MISLLICIFAVAAMIVFFMTKPGHAVIDYCKFFATGKDSGFSLKEIFLLRKVASVAGLKNPTVLYWSLEAFDKSLVAILADFEKHHTTSYPENQDFLTKLYKYRTKIEFDTPKYKKGISSTRELDVGQSVSILVRGVGVYRSRVVQNTSSGLFLSYPVASTAKIAAPEWTGMNANVYFLRKDDASYDFEAEVLDEVFVHGKPALCFSHSFSLFRTQKRKSVRAECIEPAVLYIIRSDDPAAASNESPGNKCRLEDVSEDGAAVLVGGKGSPGLLIRVDFLLSGKPVTMSGEVKAVDYDSKNNVSRLHLECKELNPDMKNVILSYVYKVMPESDKEVFDALRVLEENDEISASDNNIEESVSDAVTAGDDMIAAMASQAVAAAGGTMIGNGGAVPIADSSSYNDENGDMNE